MIRQFWMIPIIAMGLPWGVVVGGEIALQPQADVRVFEGDPNANISVQQLFVGVVNPAYPSAQASLLRFDLSHVTGTVTNASLRLFCGPDAQSGHGRGMVIEGHRLTASWDNATVSFNQRDAEHAWEKPGGDYDPTVITQVTHHPTTEAGTAVTFNVTSMVQDWVSGTVPNHGLILCQPGYPHPPDSGGEIQAFESKENFLETGTAFAPTLTIHTRQ